MTTGGYLARWGCPVESTRLGICTAWGALPPISIRQTHKHWLARGIAGGCSGRSTCSSSRDVQPAGLDDQNPTDPFSAIRFYWKAPSILLRLATDRPGLYNINAMMSEDRQRPDVLTSGAVQDPRGRPPGPWSYADQTWI